jgi:hypothetical protein
VSVAAASWGSADPSNDASTARVDPMLTSAKLTQIGAKVLSHARYVAFQMAEVAIPRNLFADILRMIAELRPPPLASTA